MSSSALAIVAAAIAIGLRSANAGWLVVLWLPLYAAVGAVHFVIHRRVDALAHSRARTVAMWISHLALVVSPLLQTDIGDGLRNPTTAEMIFVSGPERYRGPTIPWVFGPLSLAPVLTSWLAVLRLAGAPRARDRRLLPRPDMTSITESLATWATLGLPPADDAGPIRRTSTGIRILVGLTALGTAAIILVSLLVVTRTLR